jgi:uncharacterized membrane protein
MAEYSADTQAIIDRLKAEGDLARNSGTNSVRSVKIQLDRFEGIFKSISTNIASQNDILRVQAGLAETAAEKAATKEQFDEVAPPEKDPIDDRQPKSKLITDEENSKINAMSKSIESALTLKNIALAGAGAFVGYNLLKGFIDEKTGGGFTEFEAGIGPFARSLPGMTTALTDFPSHMTTMKTSIENMEASITGFTEKMEETVESLTSLSTYVQLAIGAVGATFMISNLAKLGKSVSNGRNIAANLRLEELKARNLAAGLDADGKPRVATTVPEPVKVPKPLPIRLPNGKFAPGPVVEAPTRAFANFAPDGTVTGPGQSARPGSLAKGITAVKNNFSSVSDVETSIASPAMRKVFRSLLKGLAVVGIVLTIADAMMLMHMLNDPNTKPEEKQAAIGNFLGTLIGAGAVGTAGAMIGAFGGPWGMLIGGVIGAGLGSLGGAMIGEYIAKWAFEGGDPTPEEIQALNRQVGLDAMYEKVAPRPEITGTGRNKRPSQVRAQQWSRQFGQTHNADGTPMAPVGGRGNIVEGPGDRFPQFYKEGADGTGAGYNSPMYNDVDENGRLILYDAFGKPTAIDDIQSNGPLGRMLRGELDLSALGGGGTTIVNAPVIAPSPVTVTNGGSQVTQVAFSGGGGSAGGPSLTIYGLTGSIA